MEKKEHIIILLVIFGVLALLGPILSSTALSLPGFYNIPKSYIYIMVVWLLFIITTALIVNKNEW